MGCTGAADDQLMSLILALAISFWPFGGKSQTETSRYLIPAWHVDTTRDRFTQKIVCRVYQGSRGDPDISFQRDTLAFQFGHGRNTTDADFRIDGGAVRPWTAVYPSLIASGATLTGASLTNPTDGMVILPVALLENATSVTIRPTPTSKPKTFSVAGLSDAVKAAQQLGCDFNYGFAR